MTRLTLVTLLLAFTLVSATSAYSPAPAHTAQPETPSAAARASLAGAVADTSGGRIPGATVELTGPEGRQVTVTSAEGDFAFAGLAPGTYALTVTLNGFADARLTDIQIADRATQLPPIVLELASLADTVVVTASRTTTSMVDAPATMSVLSEDVIASSAAQNYGDLLRGVPGLNVIQLSARDINLTSRQATGTLSNSQLVLLDGRSLYLDFFGLVMWDLLPTNLADIKQIEVIRGPASAVWGANALTGVVNIITRSPRESPATDLSISGGLFSRNAGSGIDRGAGGTFSSNLTFSRAINPRWAYRASAGYFTWAALPRPGGSIPVIADPRDPGSTVGGALYPADVTGPLGTAFENRGTNQPRVDFRLDQELTNHRGSLTYQGGYAGSEGIVYTGLGPFDMQRGSFMAYGKVNYRRGGLRVNAFTNIADAEAPNLLLTDPATNRPLQLNFATQTYDVEAGDVFAIGTHQVLNIGGNVRRNNFEMTIAPDSRNRTELGAYIEDSVMWDRIRVTAGARIDKFGNLDDPVFSPRLSLTVKPQADHALRVSLNRAFRSPSVVNNYIDTSIVSPTDLSGLAPLLPDSLKPLVAAPFPLVVRSVGSELPIGVTPQTQLTQEKLTAYEVAYTATLSRRTTATASFYVNDLDGSINFAQLPAALDPYTAAAPPPGWQLPPQVLTQMAIGGIFLPRTAFTYLNLGPIRQKGLELSLDQRFNAGLSAFLNYSWQADPTVLDDPNPYPAQELALPPTHRFNVGLNVDSEFWIGSLAVNYTDRAFWSDVLTSAFHGYTDAYTLVNVSAGRKWDRRLTTLLKVTNLLNRDIQQHIFGDILKANVSFEARWRF